MTRQKSPHTQTQQNTKPEQTDTDAPDFDLEQSAATDQDIYSDVEGAQTGTRRSPKKAPAGASRRNTEPETDAHEGSVSERISKRPVQGITSHSAEEEGNRQKKVVNDRPDARAGLNKSK